MIKKTALTTRALLLAFASLGMGISTPLHGARPICSHCSSVWCHTYFRGYTQCALYDANGNYIRIVAPGDTSDWCGEVGAGLGC